MKRLAEPGWRLWGLWGRLRERLGWRLYERLDGRLYDRLVTSVLTREANSDSQDTRNV
jgi:hypothetical protein